MAKLALRLRDLDSGELLVGEFDDHAGALAWLRARPPFVEVIGIASSGNADGSGLAEDVELELRTAMRPLDSEERAKAQAHDEARITALREHIAREQARFEVDLAAERAAMGDADPNRAMAIAFDLHTGLELADPSDTRPIPEVARTAVLAWVAERNEWVHGRRQHVVRALVTVWPGPIPGGDESERCHAGGQFETEPSIA